MRSPTISCWCTDLRFAASVGAHRPPRPSRPRRRPAALARPRRGGVEPGTGPPALQGARPRKAACALVDVEPWVAVGSRAMASAEARRPRASRGRSGPWPAPGRRARGVRARPSARGAPRADHAFPSRPPITPPPPSASVTIRSTAPQQGTGRPRRRSPKARPGGRSAAGLGGVLRARARGSGEACGPTLPDGPGNHRDRRRPRIGKAPPRTPPSAPPSAPPATKAASAEASARRPCPGQGRPRTRPGRRYGGGSRSPPSVLRSSAHRRTRTSSARVVSAGTVELRMEWNVGVQLSWQTGHSVISASFVSIRSTIRERAWQRIGGRRMHSPKSPD